MKRRAVLAATTVGWLALARMTHAQPSYPERPVRVIVPFAVGGNTDVVGRIYAEELGRILGQQVFVENKAGSGTVIGTDAVAKSVPDGHTLLFGTSAHAVNASLFSKLPFDPAADFVPIALLTSVPMVLSVHPKVPARDAREFVELLRRNPGRFSFGSSGNGGSLHMAVELLKFQEQISAVHIPYRGTGPALQDLLAGQIDFIIDPISTSLPHLRSGRLRALGLTTAKRSPLLPELATMQEQGFGRYETSTWNMLLAPSRTPRAIVVRLSDAVTQLARASAFTKRLADLGVDVVTSNPEHALRYLQRETQQWATVIKAAGIKPE